MFKQKERLSRQKDIDLVYKQGKKFFSGSLILFYIKNQLNLRRVAVVVSSKVSRKASERNLYKRRLREAAKQEISQSGDYVIVALKEIRNKDFNGIKKDLAVVLARLNHD